MTDDLTQTLREIVGRLDDLKIPYMLFGSVAALAYGRSRATQDFDMVIEGSLRDIRELVRSLPTDRFYVSEQAATEAVVHESLFNVIDLVSGWKVDMIPKKDRAFSRSEFDRCRRVEVLGLSVVMASVGDVMIAKLEWSKLGGGSERQLEDVRALLEVGGDVDLAYFERWVTGLGLEDEWRTVRRANTLSGH